MAEDADETLDFIPPFRKIYFSQDMVNKYEPLATAMRRVTESEGKNEEVWEEYQTHLARFKNFDWCSTWDGSRYDVVFYGVSGYSGYLLTQYLKAVALKRKNQPFTFALAGRTRSKVQELRDREFAGTRHEDTPILQMSFDDIFSIIDLVKSAHVVVNVAGPYMLTQGELLVDACVCMGAHYVDISTELPWSLRIADLHSYAMKEKAIIVPSAGTAGGYPDLGVYLCAKQARADFNAELAEAACYVSQGGSTAAASGGTLRTRAAMGTVSDDVRSQAQHPFALGGFIPERDRWGRKTCDIEFGTGKVTTRMRQVDMDATMSRVSEDKRLGLWRGPFQYSSFDTRIVRRSNMLLANLANRPYGCRLNFLEFAMLPDDVIRRERAGKGGAGAGSPSPADATQEVPEKKYAEGEGPALEELSDAWTGYFMYAEAEGGHEVRCSIVGRDSYFETARLAVETAMCLRFDRDKLPFEGGVLTPAVACGDALATRLLEGGVQIKMGPWPSIKECGPPPY